MPASNISPQELKQLIQQHRHVELIDVRTPLEFSELHADCARNIPLDRLDPGQISAGRDPSSPVYVICRSGSRGRQAAERLQAAGLTHVLNVEGGTQAWEQAGLPVVRGKKVVSLERQVRIAAGFLVLTGVALGWLVHPALIGLSAFVGAGLMFAGITDTCGMGMILAKMPWNQVAASSQPAESCSLKP
jgi:rhodanese-related sulfurtransferase